MFGLEAVGGGVEGEAFGDFGEGEGGLEFGDFGEARVIGGFDESSEFIHNNRNNNSG